MEHTVKSYRDLIAWRRARELVKKVYLLTAKFPDGERLGLTSQMDRAAVSVPSNVAEGYGRATTQDHLHFLRIARGVSHSAKPNPQGRTSVGVRTSWRRSPSLRKTSACADWRRRRRLPRRYMR